MAGSVVQHVETGFNAASGTLTVAPPALGNLLVVWANANSTVTAPTDNGANTWTLRGSVVDGNNVYIWDRQVTPADVAGLTTITIHPSSATFTMGGALEIAGCIRVAPFDQFASTTSGAGSDGAGIGANTTVTNTGNSGDFIVAVAGLGSSGVGDTAVPTTPVWTNSVNLPLSPQSNGLWNGTVATSQATFVGTFNQMPDVGKRNIGTNVTWTNPAFNRQCLVVSYKLDAYLLPGPVIAPAFLRQPRTGALGPPVASTISLGDRTLPAPAPGGATVVAHVENATNTATCVCTVAHPVLGDLLIAWANSNATVTISDNGTNSWTAGPSVIDGNAAYFWYRVATATDASSLTTVTFTPSSANNTHAGFLEVSGCATPTPFDQSTTATAPASSNTVSPPMSNITDTGANGDFVIALSAMHGFGGYTAPMSWSAGFANLALSVNGIDTTANSTWSMVGTKTDAPASALTTQASWTVSMNDRQALIMSFALAAAGAPGGGTGVTATIVITANPGTVSVTDPGVTGTVVLASPAGTASVSDPGVTGSVVIAAPPGTVSVTDRGVTGTIVIAATPGTVSVTAPGVTGTVVITANPGTVSVTAPGTTGTVVIAAPAGLASVTDPGVTGTIVIGAPAGGVATGNNVSFTGVTATVVVAAAAGTASLTLPGVTAAITIAAPPGTVSVTDRGVTGTVVIGAPAGGVSTTSGGVSLAGVTAGLTLAASPGTVAIRIPGVTGAIVITANPSPPAFSIGVLTSLSVTAGLASSAAPTAGLASSAAPTATSTAVAAPTAVLTGTVTRGGPS